MSDVANKVKEIIAEQLGQDLENVVDGANFTDDLGADSLDTVELVMALEDEFDLEIPEDDSANIKTVKDAMDYIVNNA